MTCQGSVNYIMFYLSRLEAWLFFTTPLTPSVLLCVLGIRAVLAICHVVASVVKANAQNSVLQLRYMAHFVCFCPEVSSHYTSLS